MNKATDIINLDLSFKIQRRDVDELINTINKSTIFRDCLAKNGIQCLGIIKLVQLIPPKYITANRLYKHLRKNGYYYRRKRFMQELYYLEVYGFIDRFKEKRTEYIKNITKDIYHLNIQKENGEQ